MNDTIENLVARWKLDPTASTTVALCDALCDSPRGPLIEQVGELASRRHAGDATVLLSVARMYVESGRLADAQSVLIAAGKGAPSDPRVYRWLGEVLLRRGDARRAEKVLQRAIQLGCHETATRLWLERARGFFPLQDAEGDGAVATEIAETTATFHREESEPSFSSVETSPRAFAASPAAPSASSFRNGHSTNAASANGNLHAASASGNAAVARANGDSRVVSDEVGAAADVDLRAAVTGGSRIPRPLSSGSKLAAQNRARHLEFLGPARHFEPASFGRHSETGRHETEVGPASPADTDAPAWVPHPRDVMDALALAGIYETGPGSVVAAWDRAAPGPKRKGVGTIIGGLVLFVAASVSTFVFYRQRRAQHHLQAEAVLDRVEVQLHEGKPEALTGIENDLAQAFRLESRSRRAALDWIRERAVVGLVKAGSDVALEDAMARAKEVGVPEEKYAFAQVASFLLQGDTAGAAGVLPRWDGPSGNDAWYQLVAGAALERAGDDRARTRYAAAVQIDPDLFVAKIAQARAAAFDGDLSRAMAIARGLRATAPDRAEAVALVALAWGRDPMRELAPVPPEVDAVAHRVDELPSTLKFVPYAVSALRALDRHATDDRHAVDDARDEISRGLGVSESPSAAVWLGTIALRLGDEALGRKAAVLALQFSAVYEPARALAARVALVAGRLDEALKATEELEPSTPDVALLRAAAAYERLDPDAVTGALGALAPDTLRLPSFVALERANAVLLGRANMDPPSLTRLAADDAPWGDLVAMDAALDSGDLAVANKIAGMWGKDSESRPLRALRLARLARYEGRLDAADALSQLALDHGTVTPRVLWERAFELVARGRAADVAPLIARYPLVLGPVASWLNAYASAASGSIEAAKGKAAMLDPPPETAPIDARVVAAAAFGAMKDRRRGIDYVRDVLASGSEHPDVVAAASSLGLHRVGHGRRRPTYE